MSLLNEILNSWVIQLDIRGGVSSTRFTAAPEFRQFTTHKNLQIKNLSDQSIIVSVVCNGTVCTFMLRPRQVTHKYTLATSYNLKKTMPGPARVCVESCESIWDEL